MTNTEILRNKRNDLVKVNNAIKSLASDKREKTVQLRNMFIELRENILMSIDCLQYSIKMGEI